MSLTEQKPLLKRNVHDYGADEAIDETRFV